MTFAYALTLTAQLISFSLVLFSIEMLNLSKSDMVRSVWSSKNLIGDLQTGLPLPRFLVSWLSSENTLRQLSIAELIVAVASLLFPSGANFIFLFVVHLLICIRFRGTFNGGSDQMIFVVLGGTAVAFLFKDERVAKFGLIYIAVQMSYAYFRAGLAKITKKTWLKGQALPSFLLSSPYPGIRSMSIWLIAHPKIAAASSLLVIAFELLVWTSSFSGFLATFFFSGAVAFHFVIYRAFGLNRFFWAWLSAWPSLLYLANYRP